MVLMVDADQRWTVRKRVLASQRRRASVAGRGSGASTEAQTLARG